jgi:hypothetical protein
MYLIKYIYNFNNVYTSFFFFFFFFFFFLILNNIALHTLLNTFFVLFKMKIMFEGLVFYFFYFFDMHVEGLVINK